MVPPALFHIGNARSERISILRLNPLSNPVLFLGILGAIGVHVAATYTPFFQGVLGLRPLALGEWAGPSEGASSYGRGWAEVGSTSALSEPHALPRSSR